MITVGDAQNGKRKIDNPENPEICPHFKAYNKFYNGKIASGLVVVVLLSQFVPSVIDFFWGNNYTRRNHDRRNGRR